MARTRFIVKAKEYKVKKGDSLESLADKAGITWQELARFNWGTDVPEKINEYLRNKVGCFKKTEDQNNYIFSNEDDPGIIYIPEDFDGIDFSTSVTHTVKFKLPNVKTFIPSDCIVKFRPKEDWNGEYGFDWMREGDYAIKINENGKTSEIFGDVDYNKNMIGKLYIPAGAAKENQKMQPNDLKDGDFRPDPVMLVNLKTGEYLQKNIEFTGDGSKQETFASYISIYINKTDASLPRKLEIQAYVTVREEVLDAIIFEMAQEDGSKYIKISSKEEEDCSKYIKISSKAEGALLKIEKGESQKITLIIECLKPLPSDITISAIAISRNTDGSNRRIEAGRLIVVANAESKRKHVNILTVQVKTPEAKKNPFFGYKFQMSNKGSFPDLSKQRKLIRKGLRQALIDPIFESTVTLDLSSKQYFESTYYTLYNHNKYILAGKEKKDGDVYSVDSDFPALEDYLKIQLSMYLYKTGSPLLDKLDDYLVVFYLDEYGCKLRQGDKKPFWLAGYATSLNYVVMFIRKKADGNTLAVDGTFPHEILHALGLPHSFNATDGNAHYTYNPTETENMMDYTHLHNEKNKIQEDAGTEYYNAQISTWHWQWQIARDNKYVRYGDHDHVFSHGDELVPVNLD